MVAVMGVAAEQAPAPIKWLASLYYCYYLLEQKEQAYSSLVLLYWAVAATMSMPRLTTVQAYSVAADLIVGIDFAAVVAVVVPGVLVVVVPIAIAVVVVDPDGFDYCYCHLETSARSYQPLVFRTIVVTAAVVAVVVSCFLLC